jgi:hypothetical protein
VGNVFKLLTTLFDKKNYLVHFSHLQLGVKHGIILKKIHKIIEFRQSYWLKSYIDLCTKLRQNPTNSKFEVSLMKNLANSVYGKLIQKTDYRTVKFSGCWRSHGNRASVLRYLSSPRFRGFTILSKTMIAIELAQKKEVHNKMTLAGYSVLELSKRHMYSFYYDVLKTCTDDPRGMQLCYLDTDSFCFVVKDLDFYEFMKNNPSYFDTSVFPENNQFGIVPQNYKKLGCFSDVVEARLIEKFISLRSKVYAMKLEGSDDKSLIKKVKSISRTAVRSMSFSDFHSTWMNRGMMYSKMFQILSRSHQLETVVINKKSLSGAPDDKRIILSDNIHTIPLGHKSLRNN